MFVVDYPIRMIPREKQMSEANKALVQQAYDNFRAGRIDKLLELMFKGHQLDVA
jgi:hypothetical protein